MFRDSDLGCVSISTLGTWHTAVMYRLAAAVVTGALLCLAIGGCTEQPPIVADAQASYEISTVSVVKSPKLYSWGDIARLEIDVVSGLEYSYLYVPISPKRGGGRGRGLEINPIATIDYGNGVSAKCQETDLRRYPSIPGPEGGEVRLPCVGAVPADSSTEVTIIDDYDR